jgi:hypothetical protein
MIARGAILRRYAARVVAVTIVLALYACVQLPVLSRTERDALAARFHFTPVPLPAVHGPALRYVRDVHPSLEHISAWISSVGAAVALADLDGDGLPNDVCQVETRIDQVIIAPAPRTPARYESFALTPTLLTYDPTTMAPMGCLLGDLNEDGLMDILVYYWGRTPIAFLRRDDQLAAEPASLRRESYVAHEVVNPIEAWNTNAAAFADLDGDGHMDLVIGNYFPDGARVLDSRGTGREAMQGSMSRAYNGGGPRLLLWQGGAAGAQPGVRYADVAGVLDSDVAHGWTLAVGAADLDGDLLPEIYIANDFGPDRLLHNRSTPGKLHFVRLEGVKSLTTPNSKVLGRDSFKGMGVDFGDLNGDGLLDIVVSNITTEYALEESNFVFISTGELDRVQAGVAPYVDRSEPLGLSRSGWAWDVKLVDFDNDGALEAIQATGFVKGDVNRWPELQELAMGNDGLLADPRSWPRVQPGDDLAGHQHPRFFARAENGRYYDLAQQLGLDQPLVSRGIAIADVDGDGRLDFAVANQWGPSYLYRNESHDSGAFLGLHLRLPLRPEAPSQSRTLPAHPVPDTPGRPAIGAVATVHLPHGQRLVSQVDGGNGHSGKRSPDLHFGLGRALTGDSVRVDVHWRDPSGQAQRETFWLTPGWHTIMLGWSAEAEVYR